MIVFSSNRDINTALKNVDSIRDITRSYQIGLIEGFVYERTRACINDDYHSNTVITGGTTTHNTIITDNGNITRYCQINRGVYVLDFLLRLKLAPKTETVIRNSIKDDNNIRIKGNTRYYQ